MKIICLTWFLIWHVTGFECMAQVKNNCPKGQEAFELLQYHRAIEEFEKCGTSSGKTDDNCLMQLADSYRMLDNYVMAETMYKQAMYFPNTRDKAAYWYLIMLKNNQKTDKFHQTLDSLLHKKPYDKNLKRLKTNTAISTNKDSFLVVKADFNAVEADFSPVFFKDKLVFSTTRPMQSKEDRFTGQGFSSIMMYDSSQKSLSVFPLPQSQKFNVGSAIFNRAGDTIYFSANNNKADRNGNANLQLYFSYMIDNQWSAPQLLPLSKGVSNNTHPAISPDGNIFVFSSDRETNSAMNLFYCTKNKLGLWNVAQPFKKNINTAYNEVFPVFIDDKTLIYSTDAWNIYGGLDMYQTTFENDKWSDGVLLQDPFNSSKDDYGMITDKTFKAGYFTSNRDDVAGNEDIYQFEKITKPLDTVFEIKALVPLLVDVTRRFVDKKSGKAVPDVKVTITHQFTGEETVVYTDQDGFMHIPLPAEQSFTYSGQKNGYFSESGNISTNTNRTPSQSTDLHLEKIEVDAVFVLKDIYYDFDDWSLRQASEAELKKLVNFLSDHADIKIELSSHTDARGQDDYNQKLSEKRAKSLVDYLIENGISKERMIPRGYGEQKPVNKCVNAVECTEDEHQQNRRTEIKIISK